MSNTLVNAHLPGDAFCLDGGPDGVLLVHGLSATTAEVRPLAEFLHAAGYTVSGPLLPGHGTQLDELGRYSWRDWAKTVETAYAELKARCRRVAVGGESTGAVLALHCAANHPEAAAVLAYAPALRLMIGRWMRIAGSVLAPFDLKIKHKPGPLTEVDALWKGYDAHSTKGARELLRLQQVVRPLLPAIHQPILIVQGRLDRSVDPRAPQEVYDRVSSTDKELLWLSRSTHCVALDCEREQLFERTRDFLDRHFIPKSTA